MRRRRRHRAPPGAGRIVEDAFDLFLDALANTLGVVMFIALMVVIFASPAPPIKAEPAPDPSEAPRVRALLERVESLQQELERLPHEGDPGLVARYAALLQQMNAARARLSETIEALAAASDAVRQLRRETQALRASERSLLSRRTEVERRTASIAGSSSFVRVSRFRDDPRDAILLLVAGGGVERAEPSPGETRILPGARPRTAIANIAEAHAAIDRLLPGIAPARYRIELGVWSDSFGTFKLLERALVERGFDLNPMPLAIGQALDSGAGGIQ